MDFMVIFISLLIAMVTAVRVPQPGIIQDRVSSEDALYFIKPLYAGTAFRLKVTNHQPCEVRNSSFTFRWEIKGSSCFGRLHWLNSDAGRQDVFNYWKDESMFSIANYNDSHQGDVISCGESVSLHFQDSWKHSANSDNWQHGDGLMPEDHIENNEDGGQLIAVAPSYGAYFILITVRQSYPSDIDVVLSMKGKYGYLSTEAVPALYLHAVMIAFYAICLLWAIADVSRKLTNEVHHYLVVMTVLLITYNALCYANYSYVRYVGFSSTSLNLISLMLQSASYGFMRLFILFLCGGFGETFLEVHPNPKTKPFLLAFAFFVFYLSYSCAQLYNGTIYLVQTFVILLCVADAVILYHAGVFYMQTKQRLKSQNVPSFKAKFYKFTNLLKFLFILCIVIITVVIWSTATDCSYDWYFTSVFACHWALFQLIFVVGIGIIYRSKSGVSPKRLELFFK
ncbi:unnamed protein product [Clavelina lepadiformis]|uniref:GOST seven transmembrane domain-containing protein n=1 Tax=Clavelina lepadiformis TaxID=159417 RepID=A0ABP0F221_CLALP